MAKRVSAAKYLSNVAKSVTYATVDILKDMSPVIVDTVDTNKDIAKTVYTSIRHGKRTASKAYTAVMKSQIGELAKDLKKNAIADLKSGKFYNREREDASTDSAIDDYISGDLGFGDESDEDLGFGDSGINVGDEMLADTMDEVGERASSAVGQVLIRTAEYQVEATRQSTAKTLSQQIMSTNMIHKDLSALNANMANMMTATGQALNTHVENSRMFYETQQRQMDEQTAILKEMLELQKSIYVPTKKNSSNRIKPNEVFNSSGAINLAEYFRYVQQNAKDADSGMGDMISMIMENGVAKSAAANPLSFALKEAVENFFPKVFKEALSEFNDSIAGAMSTALLKITKLQNSDNGLLAKIGEIFGFNTSLKSRINTGKYNKETVPWNGKDHKALTTVIPDLLGKIYSAVSGKPEMLYDYESGKFRSRKSIRQEFNTNKDRYVSQANSLIIPELEKQISYIKFENEEQMSRLIHAVDSMMKYNYERGDYFNPNNTTKKAKDYGITGDDADYLLSVIRQMYKNIPIHKLMKANSDLIEARDAQNEYLKSIEENGDSVFQYLFNKENQKKLKKGEKPRVYQSPMMDKIDTTNDILKEILDTVKNMGVRGTGDSSTNRTIQNTPSYNTPSERLERTQNARRYVPNQKFMDRARQEAINNSGLSQDDIKLVEENMNLSSSELQRKYWPEEAKRIVKLRGRYKKAVSNRNNITGKAKKAEEEAKKEKEKEERKAENERIDRIRKMSRYKIFPNQRYATQGNELQYSLTFGEDAENWSDVAGPQEQSEYIKSIKEANTAVAKIKAFSKGVKTLAQQPLVFVGHVMRTVDKRMYNLLFGSGEGDHESITGRIKDGFTNWFEHLKKETTKRLDEIREAAGIGEKAKSFLHAVFGIDADRWLADFKEALFGDKNESFGAGMRELLAKGFGEIRDGFKDFFGFGKDGKSKVKETITGKLKDIGKEKKERNKTLVDQEIVIDREVRERNRKKKEKEAKRKGIDTNELENDEEDNNIPQAASGLKRVSKTGVIAASEGEMIVPPDLNPYNISKRNRQEQSAISKFKSSGEGIGKIQSFAAGGTVGQEQLVLPDFTDLNTIIKLIGMQDTVVLGKGSDDVNLAKDMILNSILGTGSVTKESISENFGEAFANIVSDIADKIINELGEDLDNWYTNLDEEEFKTKIHNIKFDSNYYDRYNRRIGGGPKSEDSLPPINIDEILSRYRSGNISAETLAKMADDRYNRGDKNFIKDLASKLTDEELPQFGDEFYKYSKANRRAIKDKDFEDGQKSLVRGMKDEASNIFRSIMNSDMVKSAQDKLTNVIGSDRGQEGKDVVKDFIENAKDYMPKVAAGGVAGMGLSLMLGLAGGPLLGGAVGAGLGLLSKSSKLQTMLFGNKITDEEGNTTRDGSGIISKNIVDNINKYFPSMAKGGIIGLVLQMLPKIGAILPGGPIAGLIVGSAIGFARKNEEMRSALFGDGKSMEKLKEKVQKMAPKMGLGAAAMFLKGPFGPVANLLIGAGLGFVSDTERFKTIIFGHEGVDGKRYGGLVGHMKNLLLIPFREAKKQTIKTLNWVKNGILKPIKQITKPLVQSFANFGNWFKDTIKNSINTHIIKPLGSKVLGPLAKGLLTLGSKTFGAVLGFKREKMTLPLKAMGAFSDKFWRGSQLKKIGKASMTSLEGRIKERKERDSEAGNTNYQDSEAGRLDQYLATADKEKIEQLRNYLATIDPATGKKISKHNLEKHFMHKSGLDKLLTAEMNSGQYGDISDYKSILNNISNMAETGDYEGAINLAKKNLINNPKASPEVKDRAQKVIDRIKDAGDNVEKMRSEWKDSSTTLDKLRAATGIENIGTDAAMRTIQSAYEERFGKGSIDEEAAKERKEQAHATIDIRDTVGKIYTLIAGDKFPDSEEAEKIRKEFGQKVEVTETHDTARDILNNYNNREQVQQKDVQNITDKILGENPDKEGDYVGPSDLRNMSLTERMEYIQARQKQQISKKKEDDFRNLSLTDLAAAFQSEDPNLIGQVLKGRIANSKFGSLCRRFNRAYAKKAKRPKSVMTDNGMIKLTTNSQGEEVEDTRDSITRETLARRASGMLKNSLLTGLGLVGGAALQTFDGAKQGYESAGIVGAILGGALGLGKGLLGGAIGFGKKVIGGIGELINGAFGSIGDLIGMIPIVGPFLGALVKFLPVIGLGVGAFSLGKGIIDKIANIKTPFKKYDEDGNEIDEDGDGVADRYTVGELIGKVVDPIIDKLKTLFLGENQDGEGGLVGFLKDAFLEGLSWFGQHLPGFLWGAITTPFKSLWGAITAPFKSLWGAITAPFKSNSKKEIQDAVENHIEELKKQAEEEGVEINDMTDLTNFAAKQRNTKVIEQIHAIEPRPYPTEEEIIDAKTRYANGVNLWNDKVEYVPTMDNVEYVNTGNPRPNDDPVGYNLNHPDEARKTLELYYTGHPDEAPDGWWETSSTPQAARGLKRVSKTGVIAASEGEMIVPPDLNPYNISKRDKNEKKAIDKYKRGTGGKGEIESFSTGGVVEFKDDLNEFTGPSDLINSTQSVWDRVANRLSPFNKALPGIIDKGMESVSRFLAINFGLADPRDTNIDIAKIMEDDAYLDKRANIIAENSPIYNILSGITGSNSNDMNTQQSSASSSKNKNRVSTGFKNMIKGVGKFFGLPSASGSGIGNTEAKYTTGGEDPNLGQFVSQRFSNYSNKSFTTAGDNSRVTVSNAGCAPAAATMAINSTIANPITMEEAMRTAVKYKLPHGGVTADYFVDEFTSHGLQTKFVTDGSKNKDKVITSYLRRGNPIVLMGKNVQNRSKSMSPFGPMEHYVVATGMSPDGKTIYINDPEARKARIPYSATQILKDSVLGIVPIYNNKKKVVTGLDKVKAALRNFSGRAVGNIVYVGDFRTRQLELSLGTVEGVSFVCATNADSSWLGNNTEKIKAAIGDNKDINLVFALGFKDLDKVDTYIEYYESAAKTLGAKTIFYMSVNPSCDENSVSDKDIQKFNSALKEYAGARYIDTYNYLMDNGWTKANGHTFDDETNLKIHTCVVEAISTYESNKSKGFDISTVLEIIGKLAEMYGLSGDSDANTEGGTDSSGPSSPNWFTGIANKIMVGMLNGNVSTNPAVAEKQKQVVAKMASVEGKLHYSQEQRDPEQGSSDCSSTVQWAYKNVMGVDVGSYTGAQRDNPNTYTVANSLDDESKLQLGDILLKNGHVEMYAGDGRMIGQAGPNYEDMGPSFHNLGAGGGYNVIRRLNQFAPGSDYSGSGSGVGFASQYDSSFSNIKFGDSTVAEAGCAPVVAAMTEDAYGMNSLTTANTKESIRRAIPYKVTGSGVTADYFMDEFGRQGYSSMLMQDKDGIINSLKKENSVILLGTDSKNRSKTKSPFGPNSHYVLATGISPDGNTIYINDPEAKKGNIPYKLRDVLKSVRLGIMPVVKGAYKKIDALADKYRNSLKRIVGRGKYGPDTVQYKVWHTLRNAGYNEIAVAAVMGNIQRESEFDPAKIEKGSGKGFGLVQWTGSRRTEVEDYAKIKGMEASSLDLQLDFLISELRGISAWSKKSSTNYDGTSYTKDDWENGTDIHKSTVAFMAAYERPAVGGKDQIQKRVDAATMYYEAFTGQPVDASVVGKSTISDMIANVGASAYVEAGRKTIKESELVGSFDKLGEIYGLTKPAEENSNLKIDNGGYNSTGVTPSLNNGTQFPKYSLNSEAFSRAVDLVCHECGGNDIVSARQEASQIVNLNETQKKRQNTSEDLLATMNGGWYASKEDTHRSTEIAKQAVMDVMVGGKRVLPRYVVEHDMFPKDIVGAKERSQYKYGDEVKNIYMDEDNPNEFYRYYTFFGKDPINGKGDIAGWYDKYKTAENENDVPWAFAEGSGSGMNIKSRRIKPIIQGKGSTISTSRISRTPSYNYGAGTNTTNNSTRTNTVIKVDNKSTSGTDDLLKSMLKLLAQVVNNTTSIKDIAALVIQIVELQKNTIFEKGGNNSDLNRELLKTNVNVLKAMKQSSSLTEAESIQQLIRNVEAIAMQ